MYVCVCVCMRACVCVRVRVCVWGGGGGIRGSKNGERGWRERDICVKM